MKYLIEDKIPDEYIKQVIHYFIVMDDLEKLDFVIFHPGVTGDVPMLHIIKVTRAELEDDIIKHKEKLQSFKRQWDILKTQL